MCFVQSIVIVFAFVMLKMYLCVVALSSFNKFFGHLDYIISGFFWCLSCEYMLAVFCFCIAILYRNLLIIL